MVTDSPPVGHVSTDDIESALRSNYAAQKAAMLAADAQAIGALLAPDFTLTHMAGYLQDRAEWLSDVQSGAMAYQAMEDVDVAVDLDREDPVLIARSRTTATIWGHRGSWPLELRIHFVHVEGPWIAARTVASTWR